MSQHAVLHTDDELGMEMGDADMADALCEAAGEIAEEEPCGDALPNASGSPAATPMVGLSFAPAHQDLCRAPEELSDSQSAQCTFQFLVALSDSTLQAMDI